MTHLSSAERRLLRRANRVADRLRAALNTARLELRATEPWQKARLTKWERRYLTLENRLACVQRIVDAPKATELVADGTEWKVKP